MAPNMQPCCSCFAFAGKTSASHPISPMPLQSISTYCRGAFCSQVTVRLLGSLFRSSFFTCPSSYPECLLCLCLFVFSSSSPSTFIHLSSRMRAFTRFSLLLPLSGPALRCCSSVSSANIVPCFFPGVSITDSDR